MPSYFLAGFRFVIFKLSIKLSSTCSVFHLLLNSQKNVSLKQLILRGYVLLFYFCFLANIFVATSEFCFNLYNYQQCEAFPPYFH